MTIVQSAVRQALPVPTTMFWGGQVFRVVIPGRLCQMLRIVSVTEAKGRSIVHYTVNGAGLQSLPVAQFHAKYPNRELNKV
jgi:hypothetical protein